MLHDEERARARLRSYVERARQFSGWDLKGVAPTPLAGAETWSYEDRARQLLRGASSVLDMGTGGGEVFGELCASYRGTAVATEPWPANASVAAGRLRPRGIGVVLANSLRLPFRSETFELVLNRHEELDPAEVARVLARGGTVLTQQVGARWWQELRPFFPRMRDFGDLYRRYVEGLKKQGLSIRRAASHDWKAAYRGLGEIVFTLCVAPWEIPDFDPLGRDLPALLSAEESLSTDAGVVLTDSRFLIEATKG